MKPRAVRQLRALVLKDLRLELRTRDTLLAMALFALAFVWRSRRPSDEASRIAAKFGSLLIPVTDAPDLRHETVDVTDFDTLVRLIPELQLGARDQLDLTGRRQVEERTLVAKAGDNRGVGQRLQRVVKINAGQRGFERVVLATHLLAIDDQ